MDVSQADGIIEVNHTIPTSYPAKFILSDDEPIRLKAIPPPGYYFTSWKGDITNTYNPITMMMDCNKTIIANFDPIVYTLIIDVNGNGRSSPVAGKHRYPEGAIVSISATPDNGWRFGSWTGDITTTDVTTILMTMDSDQSVTANFSERKLGWWITTGIIAIILIIGVIIWLPVKKRTALHRMVPKSRHTSTN